MPRFATDYDETLAHEGSVDDATIKALERFKESSRRLILVTGRELLHVKEAFPRIALFDRVVAENGAVVYDPATEAQTVLGAPAPDILVAHLNKHNVAPLSVGRSIISTWEPNGATVLMVIRELGLEHQIIFNKGAVMVLPPGVNKAAGLAVALRELELSHHNVIGVGDAENDHSFLHACGCAAAVANALSMVKEAADIALAGERSAGVVELMDMICRNDAEMMPADRHGILLGSENGRDVYLQVNGGSILIAGQSGFGKSTLATALTERMVEGKFEFCVFDPEGRLFRACERRFDRERRGAAVGSGDT